MINLWELLLRSYSASFPWGVGVGELLQAAREFMKVMCEHKHNRLLRDVTVNLQRSLYSANATYDPC